MEHVETLIEHTNTEHQELSAADLDITALYEWLDRPISEDENDPDF